MLNILKSRKKHSRKKTVLLNENTSFPFQESYRNLRTNINFTTQASEAQTILVTSSIPSEGKSTVAINTAISLAKEGKKVLLIDADLRKPSLHRYLRVRPGSIPGLSSVLIGKADIEEAIGYYKLLGIDLMVAGQIPPNAAELLSLPKMDDILKYGKQEYDYVIVDTPPVGVVTDATILSHKMDGILFVVRHNYANREEIINAKKRLDSVDAKILGAVLNNYELKNDLQSNAGKDSYYYYSYKEE